MFEIEITFVFKIGSKQRGLSLRQFSDCRALRHISFYNKCMVSLLCWIGLAPSLTLLKENVSVNLLLAPVSTSISIMILPMVSIDFGL